MNTNQDNNNETHVVGIIDSEPTYSHSILGEGFYDLKIKVPRLSSENDILPVTISERLLGNYKVGDKIAIAGQFRSYNKEVDGKNKLMLTIFVKEIENIDELSNPNTIFLNGFVCKKPIYRTTPFGREICDVLIAVNRSYNKSDYLPCIAWGRNARFVNDLNVGDKIHILGRIQSRDYQKKLEDESIETRTAYEISITSILSAENENQ